MHIDPNQFPGNIDVAGVGRFGIENLNGLWRVHGDFLRRRGERGYVYDSAALNDCVRFLEHGVEHTRAVRSWLDWGVVFDMERDGKQISIRKSSGSESMHVHVVDAEGEHTLPADMVLRLAVVADCYVAGRMQLTGYVAKGPSVFFDSALARQLRDDLVSVWMHPDRARQVARLALGEAIEPAGDLAVQGSVTDRRLEMDGARALLDLENKVKDRPYAMLALATALDGTIEAVIQRDPDCDPVVTRSHCLLADGRRFDGATFSETPIDTKGVHDIYIDYVGAMGRDDLIRYLIECETCSRYEPDAVVIASVQKDLEASLHLVTPLLERHFGLEPRDFTERFRADFAAGSEKYRIAMEDEMAPAAPGI